MSSCCAEVRLCTWSVMHIVVRGEAIVTQGHLLINKPNGFNEATSMS